MRAYIATLLAVLFAISGCAIPTPTRDDVDEFPLVMHGVIDVRSIGKFNDCMMDGYEPLQSTLLNARSIQQTQRSKGIRINTWVAAGTILLVSVDIHKDGRVELRETTRMPLTDKQPEVGVFTSCMKIYSMN